MTDKLNDTWILWFHSSISNDWTSINDYQKIIEIDNLNDFWLTFINLKDFTQGLFFLMRKNDLPIWESYKTRPILAKFRSDKRSYHEKWLQVCKAAVGELLGSQPQKIAGISISPKQRNIITTVWIKDKSVPDLGPDFPYSMDDILVK